MHQKNNFNYISLFSSAGIGCYGFKLEGFDCIATNEIIDKRLDIQKFNNKCKYDKGYIAGDIRISEVKNHLLEVVKDFKSSNKLNDVDALIATPPCQGMSVANHKKNNEIKRNSLVVESIKLTNEINPKFFIYENVRSFLTTICTDVDGVDKKIEDAINFNLGGNYNILSRVVNFKNFGSQSSRTRTLVIGVRKDISGVSPLELFPGESVPKTLKQLIGDLPELTKMGSISKQDIFHSFRKYDKKMIPWVENLSEGQSAFDNSEEKRIPHRIIDGKIVFNQNKNGDKYKRWYWDKEGPCIHTRNDILASQNTIHPSQNRVFSIRELMRMMSIPKSFLWSNFSNKELNQLKLDDKQKFLKKNEMNIRQCLGEAVPTEVFRRIAKNIKRVSTYTPLSVQKINKIVQLYDLKKIDNLKEFIESNLDKYSLENLFDIIELSNSKRTMNAAYFTRKDIAYTLIKDLPKLKQKKIITVLEPSVGVGRFLPLISEFYFDKKQVIIDVIDLDPDSICLMELIISKFPLRKNIMINSTVGDFLTLNIEKKYDVIIGNPPFKKITGNKTLLSTYRKDKYNNETNNIFSFFIEKCLNIGKHVSLIVPKSLINSPEFNKSRKLLLNKNLKKITDFGEKGFRGVKIETISISTDSNKKSSEKVVIESYIKKQYSVVDKSYVFSDDYPYWILYRDSTFDRTAKKMEFNIFNVFRDRQITKKHTKNKGKIRVLKSRNIDNVKTINLDGYDCYVDEVDDFVVSRFLNKDNIVAIPNLTYYPRASFLPKNTIADGSVALLSLKNGARKPGRDDLKFFSSPEFVNFYRVARNFGTRSLNIDNNSVFFFGLLKQEERFS